LRPELEAGDVIFFLGEQLKLYEVEEQVERLGFGEMYLVSRSRKLDAARAKIRLKPASGRGARAAANGLAALGSRLKIKATAASGQDGTLDLRLQIEGDCLWL
jgi:hypothetical protein